MTVKKTTTARNAKPAFVWDEETLIGSLMSSEKQKVSVYLCKKDTKGYISVVKAVKLKTGFKPTKGFAIPYHSAQQISALINRAFKEGQKMNYSSEWEAESKEVEDEEAKQSTDLIIYL